MYIFTFGAVAEIDMNQRGQAIGLDRLINMEVFSNRTFDDLWQEAITPKYRLERSYADSLEASHIK